MRMLPSGIANVQREYTGKVNDLFGFDPYRISVSCIRWAAACAGRPRVLYLQKKKKKTPMIMYAVLRSLGSMTLIGPLKEPYAFV